MEIRDVDRRLLQHTLETLVVFGENPDPKRMAVPILAEAIVNPTLDEMSNEDPGRCSVVKDLSASLMDFIDAVREDDVVKLSVITEEWNVSDYCAIIRQALRHYNVPEICSN